MARAISEYNRKRNFDITSEPRDEPAPRKRPASALRFVIQKHDARHLHYDFRLELNGTLKSWAIPKGPSLDPKEKRLAVHVEDHPLSYAKFEGSIPQGQYGGGDVIVWDQGVWQPHGDVDAAYQSGKLKFTLIGEKLTGDWSLIRANFRGRGDKEQWLLVKEKDSEAKPMAEYDIVNERPESVISGDLLPRDLDETKSVKSTAKSKTSAKRPDAVKSATKKSSGSKTVKPDTTVALPKNFSPELSTLVSEPPEGEWLYGVPGISPP